MFERPRARLIALVLGCASLLGVAVPMSASVSASSTNIQNQVNALFDELDRLEAQMDVASERYAEAVAMQDDLKQQIIDSEARVAQKEAELSTMRRDLVKVAQQAFMIDEYLAKLAASGDLGIGWKAGSGPDVLFHGHCHQKALIGIAPSLAILKAAGCSVTESGAGCCGMAGSFGYEAEHYDVSKKIGEERLFPAVNAAAKQTVIAIAGVSCRQQVEHFTDRSTRHIAEVLAERIDPNHVWSPAAAAD